MNSIFNLVTDEQKLSSANQGMARMDYDQVAPTRDVTGANFPNGDIRMKWQHGSNKWWIPSRSYIRCRVALTKVGGAPLESADNVAPAMGLMGNLFQKAEFNIAGTSVSRIDSRFAAVDALETRSGKSKAWLDGLGASTNFWQDDFKDRRDEVTADGGLRPEQFTALTRLELGYDPLAQLEVKAAGTVDVTQDGGANLPLGLYAVGDYIRIDSGATAGSEYKILEVVTDTVGALSLRVQGGVIAQAKAVNAFSRLRPTPVEARRAGTVELIWQPPMSIFKVCHAIPGGGMFELVLNPENVGAYKIKAVESAGSLKQPGVDYDFSIVDMFLYVATVEGDRVENLTYLLDLEETQCQIDNNNGTSLVQKQFDVSPSTYALTVAFQDSRAGSSTLATGSKFVVNDAANLVGGNELTLERLFIQYAGENKPSPDADPSFAPGVDNTTQRYIETMMANGSYFDTGSAESIRDWQGRGFYVQILWPRDGSDRSTRVITHAKFSENSDNRNILLFAHSKSAAVITVQDSTISNVEYLVR